jgi:hypothetical protein
LPGMDEFAGDHRERWHDKARNAEETGPPLPASQENDKQEHARQRAFADHRGAGVAGHAPVALVSSATRPMAISSASPSIVCCLRDQILNQSDAAIRQSPTIVSDGLNHDAPISATAILAEIAEEVVRVALADQPAEKTVSLLAISLSHFEQHWKLQLELPLGLEDEKRRPSRRGMACWTADRAIDLIRDRFGWDAVGYGSVTLGLPRSVPDEFRELAEKNL